MPYHIQEGFIKDKNVLKNSVMNDLQQFAIDEKIHQTLSDNKFLFFSDTISRLTIENA